MTHGKRRRTNRRTRRSRRFWRKLFLVAGILGVVVYLLSGALLRYGTDTAIAAIKHFNSSSEITGIRPFYESVYLKLPTTVVWKEPTISFVTSGKTMPFDQIAVRGTRAELRITNLLRGDGVLSLSDGSLQSRDRPSSSDQNSQRVDMKGSIENATLPLQGIFQDPKGALKTTLRQISDLASGESIDLPIKFAGMFNLNISDEIYPCRITVAKQKSGYRLVIEEEDIRKVIASLSDDEYSNDEIALIVDHPFRAPKLLQIKHYAKSRAEELSRLDPKLPTDPYRHVLWSYLLTKSFGAEFARQVTNAHEKTQVGAPGSDSFRDFHNNDVGRRFAREGVPEAALAARVKTDPRVRR
jgi:hypothetical protein